ncbi:MAG: ribonuclease Y [Verrucomicrobia bacterium]|nr:ribonuclease Y [Verrucomicrobiota bacterium]
MSWLVNISSDAGLFEGVFILLLGVMLGYLLRNWKHRTRQAAISLKSTTIIEDARKEAETVIREGRLSANEEFLKLREEAEKQFLNQRKEVAATEKRLIERESLVNQQLESLVQQEKELREKGSEHEKNVQAAEKLRNELVLLHLKRKEELQRISRLNETEARVTYLKMIEQESATDACRLAHRIVEDAKLRAEEKAKRIIAVAIQRYAGEHAFETSTATVALPNDEIKGRIIGREGRNIRAFEAATGITVLIDDTPNAVVLSGFDPVRREIAREAMHRLILDGRIHPTRIEEVVKKVSEEMDETVLRNGEEAVIKVGVPPVHPEVAKLLGRLRFRHSFSQNILSHSIEVANLMGLMAVELGIDSLSAKRAGLLHDIGKAIDHEVEGPHAIIGADFVKRYGESDEVVNGVAGHHDEVPATCLLPILVSAADAISASRPGARSETMMTYIRRVEELEEIGMSFPGVEKCFAVHAGRELRVIVQPEQMTDDEAFLLARSIARKVEDKLQYPGQIRVTVSRETRCVEFAK